MDRRHSIQGKVALVTGANTGIGRESALALAAQGMYVFLACRDEGRTAPVLQAIRAAGGRADWLPLELSDVLSVQRCADAFLARDLPLHLLIANAGLAGLGGLSDSGFELLFAINHLGHFQLVQCLLPRLRASAPSRVVVVSSLAHRGVKRIDWDALRRPTTGIGLHEYNVSKLCNVLHVSELARRMESTGVRSYAVHPGRIATDIWRQVPRPLRWLAGLGSRPAHMGAATTLYCATSPDVADQSGLYYTDARVAQASPLANDPVLASALWERSEAWVREALAQAAAPDGPERIGFLRT